MKPSALYQQRQSRFTQLKEQYQTRFNQLSWLRVFLFLLGILFTYFLYQFYHSLAAVLSFSLFLTGFLFSLKKHNRTQYQRDHYRFLADINADELGRLQNRFIREETGDAYVEAEHYYTGDLDIFGRHSVFKLLNRTHTQAGTQRLAEWLKKAATADIIRRRQEAVAELANKLDWRQELEAHAMHYDKVGQQPESLLQWMQEPDTVRQSYWARLARFLPLITIPISLAWLFDAVSSQVAFLFIFLHLFILGRIFKTVKAICDKTNSVSRTLQAYADIVGVIEKESFHATVLKDRQEVLINTHSTASTAIAELAVILRNLNYRNNAYFYAFFGIISLWDLQLLVRTEDWKHQYREALPRWIEALGDWEAMSSLAGMAFSNPDYIFPVISEQALELRAEGLGHTLIKEEKRVNNDIAFDGIGKTVVITGSNMSGKSTFLRTVGVNVVLALAGAPVCARSFKVSVVQVFTSMRTQDSLEESVSSFYAELKRLKQLIQRAESSTPTLYFLDEILKGTNSKDRHHGAKALICQLHRYQASGFISTHDLELGKMAEEHPEYVQNYSFSSEVVEGKLYFDYKLRKGICQSFNASELMKQIGIEV